MKTQEELATEKELLKNKYGKVRTLIVPLDEDDADKKAVLFLKKPDRIIRKMVWSVAAKDSDKAIEAMLKAIYIGGDDINLVLGNDDAFAAIDKPLTSMLSVESAELKKN